MYCDVEDWNNVREALEYARKRANDWAFSRDPEEQIIQKIVVHHWNREMPQARLLMRNNFSRPFNRTCIRLIDRSENPISRNIADIVSIPPHYRPDYILELEFEAVNAVFCRNSAVAIYSLQMLISKSDPKSCEIDIAIAKSKLAHCYFLQGDGPSLDLCRDIVWDLKRKRQQGACQAMVQYLSSELAI